MKVIPVDSEYVRTHMNEDSLYRLTFIDVGKSHSSVSIKPVRSMTVERFNKALDDNDSAFVVVLP